MELCVQKVAPDHAPCVRIDGSQDTTRDAGYWGSARMVLEAALCLVDEAAGGQPLPGTARGGVLTPAAGCGMALVERLRDAGMTWEVCPGEDRHF